MEKIRNRFSLKWKNQKTVINARGDLQKMELLKLI